MLPDFFRFRTRVILTLVVLWACAITYSLLKYTVLQRDALIQGSRSIAWKTGVLPSIRGRILDADGIPLAWTEISSEVYLDELPANPVRKQNLLNRLEEEFNFTYHDDMQLPIRVSGVLHMDREFLERLCEILDKYKELRLVNSYERHHVDYTILAEKIGTCGKDANGVITGASGLEHQYDSTLAGVSGKFEIMQDRNGRWYPQTLVVLQKPVSGSDIRLDKKLSELLHE